LATGQDPFVLADILDIEVDKKTQAIRWDS